MVTSRLRPAPASPSNVANESTVKRHREGDRPRRRACHGRRAHAPKEGGAIVGPVVIRRGRPINVLAPLIGAGPTSLGVARRIEAAEGSSRASAGSSVVATLATAPRPVAVTAVSP